MKFFRAVAATAALTTALLGAPVAAQAAPVGQVQVDVCATVSAVAGPILALVDLGVISIDAAVALIAQRTGLPIAAVTDCLGL